MNYHKTKSVDWSYPTSPNAHRFGFKDGCYTISTTEGCQLPVAVSGHATKEQAMEASKAIPLPWSKSFQRFNNISIS
jgi:hypothetical protein